jgi:hypothetical protein
VMRSMLQCLTHFHLFWKLMFTLGGFECDLISASLQTVKDCAKL